MIEEIIKLIDAYWKFDEHQYPMSSWHDKHDLIEAVKQVKNCNAPAVSVNAVEVCEKCENRNPCKKHGVYGINCIKLEDKQT